MPNILIIEDQVGLRESIGLALEGPGCDIRCAKDAEQGILYLENWDADLVIVDYMLPNMTGMEFIKEIKGAPHPGPLPADAGRGDIDVKEQGDVIVKPRIILMSAMMNPELRRVAMAAGADWCLEKPFELSQLRRVVGELLKP